MGQKPTQLQRHCLWWPDRGSGGCEGGGTWYPAGRPPRGAEHPCTSASVPAPGILTKLPMSPGGPRGQPGASVRHLALHYRPVAASFGRAGGSPVPHGPRGLGQGAESRHPTTDRVLLPDHPTPPLQNPAASPSAPTEKTHFKVQPPKRPISRYFSSWPFFPFARAGTCGVKLANPPVALRRASFRKGAQQGSQGLETPAGQRLRQGLGEGRGPQQMSRADPAPPRAPQRKQKKKQTNPKLGFETLPASCRLARLLFSFYMFYGVICTIFTRR